MNNIFYKTDEISKFFNHNRIKWDQFYESEKKIINGLNIDSSETVLDIGCACGGLGLALEEKFNITRYSGIEINNKAAEFAKKINPRAKIYCGDLLDLSQGEIMGNLYNIVFSLSCVDWNTQFTESLEAAWRHVIPGGNLVVTFRLTNELGVNDINKSFQYINYSGKLEGEVAAYVVLNFKELIVELEKFNPETINAFGYWGLPSETAITPLDKICFAAFSIRKKELISDRQTNYKFDLPEEFKL
tara:strand:+ start:496 stop:1230 length:735 start_codon:yes stop_codon:yes gene_type:complete